MERDEEKTDDYSDYNGSVIVWRIQRWKSNRKTKKKISERRKNNLISEASHKENQIKMSQVQEATSMLVTAVERSIEYISYQNAKNEILKYPLLKAKADEYRKRNYELQNARVDVYEEAEKLQREYIEILENTLVRNYLNAENAFCRIIQQINWQIIETLDFEADFENQTTGEAEGYEYK